MKTKVKLRKKLRKKSRMEGKRGEEKCVCVCVREAYALCSMLRAVVVLIDIST